MTVRTLSGATVTLVGRGANYPDSGGFVPSFIDAQGTEYFITISNYSNLAMVRDGKLDIFAGGVVPFELSNDRCILVDKPSDANNSTSALVFAKRCGIDVNFDGLNLYYPSSSPITLADVPLVCDDGLLYLTSSSNELITAFIDGGWGGSDTGYIDCSFGCNSDASAYNECECYAPFLQWSDESNERIFAHNAWIFILAGVPESVFATE